MRKISKTLLFCALIITIVAQAESAIEQNQADVFVGQDLYLQGTELISYQMSTGEHTLIFQGGFSMSVGSNHFQSGKAVVWLESVKKEYQGRTSIDYRVRVYLVEKVLVQKGASYRTTDLRQKIVENGHSIVVHLDVTGEVFITAEKREVANPRDFQIYKEALQAMVPVLAKSEIRPEARVPGTPEETILPGPTGYIESVVEREKKLAKAETQDEKEKEPKFIYPVNISPAGETALKFESVKRNGMEIDTVIGRVYVWQKQDEEGNLLELQADNIVIYRDTKGTTEEAPPKAEDVLAKGPVKAIYLSGDVVLTEGQRTIRADEVYYDFDEKKALAVNAVMKNYDEERGIPIYVKAARLQQVAENKFAAEHIVMTSSEFYQPQISFTASSILITDTTTLDQQKGKMTDSSYDAEMRDVRLKSGDRTLFYWPKIRSNLQRPDVPLKSLHFGNDNTWGTSLESRWYLSRVLGLREPEGVDSTMALDYFSERGVGGGAEIEYENEDYFGRMIGYIVNDRGEDRLGRNRLRENIEPPRDLRGRASLFHRQYLPYNWQLTTGIGYVSDEHFLEQYYRGEYQLRPEQETYVYLKRIEENWGVDLLGKARINDFADVMEEAPSAGYYLVGQSLFNDAFTLYSDTQIGRYRQRVGKNHSITISEDPFTFAQHTTELDMPLRLDPFKVVPFTAVTFGYDDRSGFNRSLVDGTGTGSFGEDQVWIGQAGVRVLTQYWSVYPNVQSRLFDLNQIRHIIKPELTAVTFEESDSLVEQHNILNFGVSQRLQTKRGPQGKERTVDWMRLDTDLTWVNNSEPASSASTDRLIWSRPFIPLSVFAGPKIFYSDLDNNLGLRRFETFGPRRNYFASDYIWRVSDTTAVLSDMNYDMQSGVVQQYNVGFTRLVWPNLSYYVGSRYLRRVEVLDEKGSNAFTFAATYILDPRYTLVFSQQFDFDYGANIRSDVTLIRRYHRMFCSLTLSSDDSLDQQSVVFSIWPQGVQELAIGSRRYTDIGSGAY
ncbi:MAG: LPS-assembly protein LptD [Planctomycetota bacterium]